MARRRRGLERSGRPGLTGCPRSGRAGQHFLEQRAAVFLAVAIKGHQVAVDVVDDFGGAGRLRAKERQAAAENFAVGRVRGDQRQEVLEQAALASRPTDDGARRR